MSIFQVREPRNGRVRPPDKVTYPRQFPPMVFHPARMVALETVFAREGSRAKGNCSCKPNDSIDGGSELASRTVLKKRQKIQLTGLAVTPQAPHLMRNHFISSAPGGHQFSTANLVISGKFQRLGTIISMIVFFPGGTKARPSVLPAPPPPRGCQPTVLSNFLYAHMCVFYNTNNNSDTDGRRTLCNDSNCVIIPIPPSLYLPDANICQLAWTQFLLKSTPFF